MLYRDFATAEAIDREYNLVQAVPDAGAIADGWAARSEDARAALDGALGVRYGPTRAEYVDIFPPAGAAGPSPVHVFIHGGYWRHFSARDFSFVARPLAARGAVVAVANYALCPEVSVGEILRQCRAALAWVHDRIADYGGDAARISVSGHSAGGHLAAMALATDWPGAYGRPADLIKAAIPISGVFDLAPIPYTFVQPWVQLGWDEVRTLSPINRVPPGAAPVTVAVGGAETAEFVRQSKAWREALRDAGREADWLEIPGRHHFDILDELESPESALSQAFARAIGL